MTGANANIWDLPKVPHAQIAPSAWLAPNATIIGDVKVSGGSSLWYGCVLRGDNDAISIGRHSNLQDNVSAHADPGFPLHIGERVSVGHGAILHGCTIDDNVLVGMGAIVMNGATIGSNSIVAAGALVTQGQVIPPNSVVSGVPARNHRPITAEEKASILKNATDYIAQIELHRAAAQRDVR